jgi:branched-chain amino acid transport system permease protein
MAGQASALRQGAAPTSRAQLIFSLGLLAILAALPLLGLGFYWKGVVISSLYFAILSISWNLLSGYTGLFSLAPGAFAMLGAYTSALLWTYAKVPPIPGIVAAIAVTAFVGMIVGALTLRLSGPYLALTTLAFAEILRIVALNSFDITRGDLGLEVPALFTEQVHTYYAFIIAVSLLVMGLHWFLGQPYGLYLRAIRSDETAARARGVRTVYWKVFIFSASAGLSGFAGALFAHYIVIVSPSLGNLLVTGLVFSMVIIGGMGTLAGPLLGAILVNVSSEFLRAAGDLQHIVFALLLILFARFCREGIVGRGVKLWRQWCDTRNGGAQ